MMKKMSSNSISLPLKTTISGYLYKMGKVVKNWKKRFFQLEGDKLHYYKKDSDQNPVGTIIIEKTTSVQAKDFNSEFSAGCGFVIITPSRIYYLVSESQDVAQNWISTLMRVIWDINYQTVAPHQTKRRSNSDPSKNPVPNSSSNVLGFDKETALRVLVRELDEKERALSEVQQHLKQQIKRNESLAAENSTQRQRATKEIQKRNEKIELLEKKCHELEKLNEDYEALKEKYFIALGVGIKLNHVAFYSKTDLKNLYKDAPSNIDEWIEWLNSKVNDFSITSET